MLLKERLKNMTTIEIYELVLDRSISRFPENFWEGQDGRLRGLECVEYLLREKLNWSNEDIRKNFCKQVLLDNKLGGMLSSCFDNSPLKCILMYMKDTYQPWQYQVAPTNYWTKETAREAIKFMFKELNWSKDDIKKNLCQNTFKDFGLLAMLSKFYKSSPYRALNDVMPMEFHEWELQNTPLNFWNRANCKKAVTWLLNERIDKNIDTLTCEEVRNIFVENGLEYMLAYKFKSNVKKALSIVDIELPFVLTSNSVVASF